MRPAADGPLAPGRAGGGGGRRAPGSREKGFFSLACPTKRGLEHQFRPLPPPSPPPTRSELQGLTGRPRLPLSPRPRPPPRHVGADVLFKMLRFNAKAGPGANGADSQYKVLVLDAYTRQLISPLLAVNDLRKYGVTLHLLVQSDRQNIPDVAAVYFVQPTPENIKRIYQDVQMGVYESFYLNFSSTLPAALLDEMAGELVKGDCLGKVCRVYDQYLAFVSLEESLFSLMMPRAYTGLNSPNAQDTAIQGLVGAMVEGIFTVLVTAGVVPVIRCPRGGLAQHVAAALEGKIREHLAQRNNVFSEGGVASYQRPILVLFDRNFDLVAQLQHGWTYHALVHDILGLQSNKVTIPDSGGGSGKTKTYNVGDKDFFWEENGNCPFPKVAEEVEVQLGKYKRALEDVNRSTVGADIEESEALQANTRQLMNAVSSLPELTERKNVIDRHTNIATCLLNAIKTRQIDHFCSLEEEFILGKADKAALLKILSEGKGAANDKLRVCLVWLLTCETVPSAAEMEEVERILQGSGADVGCLRYVRRLRNMNLTGQNKTAGMAASNGSASQGNFLDIADKLYSQGLNAVTKGMLNLMGVGAQNAVTRTVEALMDGKGGEECEAFLYLDPKVPRGTPAGERAKAAVREAIVFVCGGGTYLEYHSLREWASQSQPKRHIAYGATEMLNGETFLGELSALGKLS